MTFRHHIMKLTEPHDIRLQAHNIMTQPHHIKIFAHNVMVTAHQIMIFAHNIMVTAHHIMICTNHITIFIPHASCGGYNAFDPSVSPSVRQSVRPSVSPVSCHRNSCQTTQQNFTKPFQIIRTYYVVVHIDGKLRFNFSFRSYAL